MGVAVAAIPGAIFFDVVRRTVVYDLWAGIKVAVGEFIGHVVALAVILFAIRALTGPSLNTPYTVFYFLGALLMGWLGVVALKVRKTDVQENQEQKVSPHTSLLVGFLISITDPFIVALWISLTASTLSHASIISAFVQIVVISTGFLAFFAAVAITLKVTTAKLNTRYIVWFSWISGIVLLYFSLSFLYKAIQMLG